MGTRGPGGGASRGLLWTGIVAATVTGSLGLGGCATTAPPRSAAASGGGRVAGSQTSANGSDDDNTRRAGLLVLAHYRDALVAGHPGEAWALLAPGSLDRESFSAYFQAHRQGMILEAEGALRAARSAPHTEVAFVRSAARVYELVRTASGWRIRSVGPAASAPSTPAGRAPPHRAGGGAP